jgi:pimeloyl-ACP methyl ester carboxylesterase
MSPPTNWNQDTTSSLISIGTLSLNLRAAGPPRSPDTPAIISIPGLGDSSVSFSAVLRHISAFARIYTYDRTGLGNSEIPANFTSEDKSYVNIAKELKLLLETAKFEPPYLMVMHSMAGLIGREFLHLYPEDIAGMVFIDTITEENYKYRPANLPGVMRRMWEGVDKSFLWKERRTAFTDDELQEVLKYEGFGDSSLPEEVRERVQKAAGFEAQNLIPSSDSLSLKKQFDTIPLGDKPVSVIKGDAVGEWKTCFERAVAAGKGTEEERKMAREYLETADERQLWLQFKQLRLSRNSRMVGASGRGHNVQWYEPGLVAREVGWCLQEFKNLAKS